MSSVSCSICWDIVTSTSIVSYLMCGHVYHHACVQKWLTTSRTCPECRCAVTSTKRVYLNLVPDPEIDDLKVQLNQKTKELNFSKTDNEIQDAMIKQLEYEMLAQLLVKDEELKLNKRTFDELKSSTSSIRNVNEELKQQLKVEKNQNVILITEVKNLKVQLAASEKKNLELIYSGDYLKQNNQEQAKQILDLHAEISNLTERLDQFRSEFVTANNKLQAQLQENETIKNERDSLMHKNSQLIMEAYNMKLQVDNRDFAYKLLERIRKKYDYLIQSSASIIHSNNQGDVLQEQIKNIKNFQKDLKIKRRLLKGCGMQRSKSDANLKIKLIKSKLAWCRGVQSSESCDAHDDLKIKLVKSQLSWKCVKSSDV